MGHRIEETFHIDRASADAAQADAAQAVKGTPGYSEVYGRGVFPCKVFDPLTGEEVDGWKSVIEIYYG